MNGSNVRLHREWSNLVDHLLRFYFLNLTTGKSNIDPQVFETFRDAVRRIPSYQLYVARKEFEEQERRFHSMRPDWRAQHPSGSLLPLAPVHERGPYMTRVPRLLMSANQRL
ncbi:hypothetical protein SAMN04487926_11638 [Paraburkholderia steynii]|uniref:Uncharacterized protein n=1 Tax=Paraburkholderia steynii TaxID=1245441 RepID=A0A7Z7FIV5_9BURK|nr:hypothetical protein SAMN04487926_11638 [Paraburkholderia steynii]